MRTVMNYNVIKNGQILGVFHDEEEALTYADTFEAQIVITTDKYFDDKKIVF